jgi:dolichol-phosphate mannosyltransferase
LCVVSACYNEREVIRSFYEALRGALDGLEECETRVLFVDDGSEDDTLEILNEIADRDERVLVYSLSRNFGHQAALSAGLAVADADAVVMMDADLQHPPELIPRMLKLWREGADVVSAERRITEAPAAKRVASTVFYRLINALSDTQIPESVADFCLLNRRAQRALLAMPERHRFLRGLVAWMGFRRVLLPYAAPARPAGAVKYSLGKMIALAMDAVLSFSTRPVRIASRIGLAVAVLGAVYLVYILARAVLAGDLVPGWGSLLSVVLILGGLQLLFVGITGEYVARIFEEVKGRPLYFFKQTPESRALQTTQERSE